MVFSKNIRLQSSSTLQQELNDIRKPHTEIINQNGRVFFCWKLSLVINQFLLRTHTSILLNATTPLIIIALFHSSHLRERVFKRHPVLIPCTWSPFHPPVIIFQGCLDTRSLPGNVRFLLVHLWNGTYSWQGECRFLWRMNALKWRKWSWYYVSGAGVI